MVGLYVGNCSNVGSGNILILFLDFFRIPALFFVESLLQSEIIGASLMLVILIGLDFNLSSFESNIISVSFIDGKLISFSSSFSLKLLASINSFNSIDGALLIVNNLL